MARFESKVVGIDLGTTNTLISYYDEIGERGECCVTSEGTNLLPSAVFFESAEEYIVGSTARDAALLNPDRTAMYFKRKMGVSKEAIEVDGKIFSPQQLSALVLKEAAENARNELEEEIRDVVITVPAYFNSDARQATIEAGTMAGLNVREVLDEPIAAIYHCDSRQDLVGEVVLIFDLGGGTLDLAVTEITEDTIDEIAINGDLHLGGSDWDLAFVEYIRKKYLKRRKLSADAEQELLLNAERAKIALSKKERTRITVLTRDGRIPVELTREEFDACTEKLREKVRTCIQELMGDLFEKGITEFDKILLVGGATRMVQIEKMLGEIFPDAVILGKDRDEAVAKGAAVYARMLSDSSGEGRFKVKRSFRPKKLNRISTRSYGLAALLGEAGERKVCNMIFRSAELPVSRTKSFFTSCDNQRMVNLRVYENVSNDRYVDIQPENLLGNCILEIPEDLQKGADIEVSLTVSENGVLSLEGREPVSGRTVRTTMDSRALLEADEIMAKKGEIDQMKKTNV